MMKIDPRVYNYSTIITKLCVVEFWITFHYLNSVISCRMPSVKSHKIPATYIHHPPTNRAFALRMMNSAQNTEVKMSPLDRALKPFKEGFKKTNKTKKAKGRGSQTPPACTHFNNECRQDEVLDVTFESENEGPNPHNENNGSTRLKDYHQDKLIYSVTNIGSQCNNRLHGAHMTMEDISEEEELGNCDKEENCFGYDELRRLDRHAIARNGKRLAAVDLQDHRILDGELDETKYSNVGDQAESLDKKMYFVAPNGEIVRLRRKKQGETTEDDGKSRASALRTEKFGKRLSLLCHMLAEKYPEDFHILELLVELQVSNEKREDEMNKSVSLLKEKVESMEQRLVAVEQQSFSGFREMLLPLAAAAEAFSVGMKHSLSAVIQHNEIKNNDGEISHVTHRRQSEEDVDVSFTSGVLEKEDTIQSTVSQDLQQQNEEFNGYCEQIQSPREAMNDCTITDNQANDAFGVKHDMSNGKNVEACCKLFHEKICVEEVEEVEKVLPEIVPNRLDIAVQYNDQDSFKYAARTESKESNEGSNLTSVGINSESDQEKDLVGDERDEDNIIHKGESDDNSLNETECRTFLASETSV